MSGSPKSLYPFGYSYWVVFQCFNPVAFFTRSPYPTNNILTPILTLYCTYWNWAKTTQGRNNPGSKQLTYLGHNDPPPQKKMAETTQILHRGSPVSPDLKDDRLIVTPANDTKESMFRHRNILPATGIEHMTSSTSDLYIGSKLALKANAL